MSRPYILYGWEHSLFTGKLPGYLRFKRIEFEQRIATPEVYESIIVPRVGAPIIPVLETPDGQILQDTTIIIDYLEERVPEGSVYPAGPVQRLIALMLEHYGDEWLVIPAMHYRWSMLEQQREFIAGEFGRCHDPQASFARQVEIGESLFDTFLPWNARVGISQHTIPGIERGYEALLSQLDTHFERFNFLLGSRPSIGDYGLLGPLNAHLGRDPVPRALMESLAPRVCEWLERMRWPEPLAGDFLPDDEIPQTLFPVLETLGRDFLPYVMQVINCNAAWLEQHPGTSVPRFHGMGAYTTHGALGERHLHSYSQWMFQRPWSHYRSLAGTARERADALLQRIGALAALQSELPHLLKRQPGRLELVPD